MFTAHDGDNDDDVDDDDDVDAFQSERKVFDFLFSVRIRFYEVSYSHLTCFVCYVRSLM